MGASIAAFIQLQSHPPVPQVLIIGPIVGLILSIFAIFVDVAQGFRLGRRNIFFG
ncbi:hypothetical protein ACFLV5_06395 [Chloroflexota bacterium]